MGNSPSADLGGGSTHSSRDARTANPEMEVKRSLASRAPTHNEYNELPASSKPHNRNNESDLPKALSTLATIVAEFGDSRRFWRQSPNSATIVASVDRA